MVIGSSRELERNKKKVKLKKRHLK